MISTNDVHRLLNASFEEFFVAKSLFAVDIAFSKKQTPWTKGLFIRYTATRLGHL